MQAFRNLHVWRMAHAVTLSAYRLAREFPKEEQFALASQIRRAAASIPANIAEGCGRGSDVDFARYLQIAVGSSCELEYHLLLAADLHFIPGSEQQNLTARLSEVRQMLVKLMRKLRSTHAPN